MANSKVLNGKKILLVEDDNFLSNMIAQKLADSGSIFLHAASGEEAVATLQRETPDVVLLDLLLPGSTDGFAVLEKMRANHNVKNIPVIVLSNLSRPQDIERAMTLGASRYLVKASVVPDEIVSFLESALSAKK